MARQKTVERGRLRGTGATITEAKGGESTMNATPTGYFVIERRSRRVRSIHSSWSAALRYARELVSWEDRADDEFNIGVADAEYWTNPFVVHRGDWSHCEDLRIART